MITTGSTVFLTGQFWSTCGQQICDAQLKGAHASAGRLSHEVERCGHMYAIYLLLCSVKGSGNDMAPAEVPAAQAHRLLLSG